MEHGNSKPGPGPGPSARRYDTAMSRVFLVFSFLSAPLVAQSGWSSPTLETALSTTASDSGANLSGDGLTAHWASFVSGDWEIWSATRTSRSAAWSAPNLETALSDPTAVDSEPCLSADGLTIHLASMRSGGAGSFDILRSTRATLQSPWSTPVFVTELNSTLADSSPSITADGLEIYFLTTGWSAPNPPQNAIHVARRTTTANPFGTPTLVAELANANTHRDVDIGADGLSITYTEYDSGLGRIRVFQATRTDRAAAFGTAAPLTEFDTAGTLGVFNFSRTRDGLDALLSVGFPAGSGSQELMSSRFEGLTSVGAPTTTVPAELHYRDSASAGSIYALVLSGGNTGFALGSRFVPVDADALFALTIGQSYAGFTGAFTGTLDAQGEAVGTVLNPLPMFAGIKLWACAFTVDISAPFVIGTISNAVAIELQ